MSDCLKHESPAVWALLVPVIKKIKQEVPDFQTLHIQSDGPTAQYKNKTNFFFFQYFCQQFELKNASWNYTAAGHGIKKINLFYFILFYNFNH